MQRNDVNVASKRMKFHIHAATDRRLVEKLFSMFPNMDLKSTFLDLTTQWPKLFSKFIGKHMIRNLRNISRAEVTDELRKKLLRANSNWIRYFLMQRATPNWVLEIYARSRVSNSLGTTCLNNPNPDLISFMLRFSQLGQCTRRL